MIRAARQRPASGAHCDAFDLGAVPSDAQANWFSVGHGATRSSVSWGVELQAKVAGARELAEAAATSDSVSEGAWKLIHSHGDGSSESFELYDRVRDPAETADLADQHPDVVSHLRALLEAQESRPPAWQVYEAEISERMLMRLQALGYAR